VGRFGTTPCPMGEGRRAFGGRLQNAREKTRKASEGRGGQGKGERRIHRKYRLARSSRLREKRKV